MGKPLTPLTKAIQDYGMSPQQFAPEVLGLKYPTFQYQVRNRSMDLDTYHKILFTLGKTFEELFPNPYYVSGRELSAPAQARDERPAMEVAPKKESVSNTRSQALPSRIDFNRTKAQDTPTPEPSQLPTETTSALPQGTEAQPKEQKKEGVSSTPSAPGFKALRLDVPILDRPTARADDELPKWDLPSDVAEIDPPSS